MQTVNIEKFDTTPLEKDPYEFLIVPNFVKKTVLCKMDTDYPPISEPGSFPLSSVSTGPAFNALIEEMRSIEVRSAFSKKFALDLESYPLTITVRGHCHLNDGRIHTDSESKILTVLIYMNDQWNADEGRLRILRSANDLDNYVAEVPPNSGTLLAFRRSSISWHGHEKFQGKRRVIQLNWMVSRQAMEREMKRHTFSALIKTLNPFVKKN